MEDECADSCRPYRLLRKGGVNEMLFALRAETQTFSNLGLAATYFNAAPTPITPEILISALKAVIQQHPALCAIPIKQRVGGKHQVWEGRLKSIDVTKAIEWREDAEIDACSGLSKIMADIHNQIWFPIDVVDQPRWKVVVLQRRHIIFVCDHYVADGQSMFAFHRSLAAALDSAADLGGDGIVQVPDNPPPPPWTEDCGVTVSIWALIRNFLSMKLFRLVHGQQSLLFSDATPDDRPITKVLAEKKRPTTHSSAILIDKSTQAGLHISTKKFNASLNSIVMVALIMALAEIYPSATHGLVSCPYSVRAQLEPPRSVDEIGNLAVTFHSTEQLHAYRIAAGSIPSIWSLAADYKQRLDHDRDVTKRGFQDSLGIQVLGSTLEDAVAKGCPNFAAMQRNGFRLSNVGLFKQNAHGSWRITDVHFSQGIEHSAVGSAGINFSMAGAEGAGIWLYASYESGVLPGHVAKEVLTRAEIKLKALANGVIPI